MNWFTLYWTDGRRMVVCGETLAAALNVSGITSKQYGHICWYDNGVTETHWYDSPRKAWIKYKEITITPEELHRHGVNFYKKIMSTHDSILVELPTMNIVGLSVLWEPYSAHLVATSKRQEKFIHTFVKCISVYYGIRRPGTLLGNTHVEEHRHHYVKHNRELFEPGDFKHAFEALTVRVSKTDPIYETCSRYAKPLSLIYREQSVRVLP